MKSLGLQVLAGMLPLICAAHGQSLAEKNMIAQDKVQVAELAASANKECGTTIAFSMDYPTFSGIHGDPDNVNDQSPWSYFADVTDALKSVCGTPDGKAAVKAKIQKVVVSHTKADQSSESLSGGTFHLQSSYKQHNVQNISEWLNKNL